MSGVKRVISPCEEHNENSLKKLKKDELKPDESDTNSLEKQDNYDHVFDQDDGFDLKALEIAEKNVRIAKLDLTQWQRCIVKEISKNMRTFALVLHVSGKVKGEGGDQQEAEGKCHLQGPWYHTKVYVGNVVSVKAIWDKRLEIYKVDNDHGFCVINPDVLISSTSVVASMFCPRKTVLEDRFKNLEPDNKVMVIGSLVHELFQMVLEKGVKELKDIEKLAADLLKSRETAFKLYSSQLTQADTTSEVKHFVQSIYQFVQQYVDERQASTFPIQKESFQGCIAEINDIEENLWVPQLGIKGKIDVSVKIHPRPQKSKTVRKEQIVPLELKTGRASFSVEHRGQLILYEMMLTAIGQPTDTGLLLYLRENLMREIQGSRNEQRDLIFLRNELSNYLSVLSDNIALPEELQDEDEIHIHPFKLPEPISRPAACSRCKSATICCSFAKTELTVTKFLHDRERLELMALKMCHLSPGDLAYFVQWSQLLVMEELEVRKSDNSSALFSQTPKNRQQNGRAICNLKISQQPIEKEESRFKHQFVVVNPLNDSVHETQAEDNIDLTLSGFSVGEYVIVSTTNRLAIATGYVTELTSSTVTVNLERNLEKKYKQQTFIIDKYESKSGDAFNFTTLGMLIEPTERSALLRAIVAERKPPIFKKMLPKIIATEGAPIMEQLNSVQRSAVIKALTTENYMLIKGLPGTGKTQTLVAIVRLLYLMGKSVLITSHTHSAVDNLLLRLKTFDLPFLRLGSSGRVNPQLKDYSEAVLTANCHTETELSNAYESFQIVGVTCLGATHPIFLHRTFNFCIVDEATQVMQVTVLRPLFFSQRFILVGDPDQLPPLIKSPEARQKGADESLFMRLDSEEATSVLTLQYRMNKTITKLANELTYRSALQCASDEVKSAVMSKSIDQTVVKDKWLQRVLQTHVDQSVFLLDTTDCSERSFNYANSKHSTTCSRIEIAFNEQTLPLEAVIKSPSKSSKRLAKYTNYCEAALVFKIVKALLISHYEPERIGIIAPYRAQVELLKKLALQHHTFYQNSSKEHHTPLDFSAVEVNTVDQYQGRDKDIIIYSCCRTGPTSNESLERNRDAEILEDKRRLTVAITRPKHKLIIIGDSACIQQYTPFKTLISHIPSFCKLQLEDDKLGFHWSQLMDELSQTINVN